MDDLSRFCCLNSDCPDYGKRGHGNLTVPARSTAKAKTVAQLIAVGLAVAPSLTEDWRPANVMLWVSVSLAVISAHVDRLIMQARRRWRDDPTPTPRHVLEALLMARDS